MFDRAQVSRLKADMVGVAERNRSRTFSHYPKEKRTKEETLLAKEKRGESRFLYCGLLSGVRVRLQRLC